MSRICVYCGASEGSRPDYRHAAARLGQALARHQVGLVYGAGRTGLMGALAEAALRAGVRVVGVVPQSLNTPDLVHGSLTELRVTPDLRTRKALMEELSDASAALPGGYGTLDELCEATASAQLGLRHKPVGLLNVAGYFDALLRQIERAVADGFVAPRHRDLVRVSSDPDELIERLFSRTD